LFEMVPPKQKRFSLEELSEHTSEWIAIEDSVFDIQKFLSLHPGGKEVILPHLGRRSTEFFVSDRVHSHSKRAWNMLQRYKIGVLEDESEQGDTFYPQHPLTNLVDMNKPILKQILDMNPKVYHEWLHGASSGSTTIRIFSSDWMELFTRWPWWYIFVLWLPVISYALSVSLSNTSLVPTLATFWFGVFMWALSEYLVHRFLFHIETNTTLGNFYHFFAHGIHHLIPLDATRLTFPPPFSIGIGLILWNAMAQLKDVFPTWSALYGGVAFGYMLYDAVHYFFHHGTCLVWFDYLQRMKTRHLKHHFSHSNKNFGVTSPLFDHIFGTYSLD